MRLTRAESYPQKIYLYDNINTFRETVCLLGSLLKSGRAQFILFLTFYYTRRAQNPSATFVWENVAWEKVTTNLVLKNGR